MPNPRPRLSRSMDGAAAESPWISSKLPKFCNICKSLARRQGDRQPLGSAGQEGHGRALARHDSRSRLVRVGDAKEGQHCTQYSLQGLSKSPMHAGGNSEKRELSRPREAAEAEAGWLG